MPQMPPIERPPAYIVLAVAVVATGALSAMILPPALAGAGLLVLLLRVCWLDENIKADLLAATELPDDYRRTAAEAPRAALAEPLPEDPALVASAMRGQGQAWTAAGLGALSVLVVTQSGWGLGTAMLVAAVLFAIGLMQADRLVTTLVHLDRGEPLPPHMLARSRGWAHSWRVGGDE